MISEHFVRQLHILGSVIRVGAGLYQLHKYCAVLSKVVAVEHESLRFISGAAHSYIADAAVNRINSGCHLIQHEPGVLCQVDMFAVEFAVNLRDGVFAFVAAIVAFLLIDANPSLNGPERSSLTRLVEIEQSSLAQFAGGIIFKQHAGKVINCTVAIFIFGKLEADKSIVIFII